MIGVLLLTNAEYCVYQSVRHANSDTPNAQHTETELNFDTGCVTVVGAFGVKYVFVVDVSRLLRELPSHQRAQTRVIQVNFAAVLLAAQKAYMRNLIFKRLINRRYVEKATGLVATSTTYVHRV